MQSSPRFALRASTLALAVALAACSGGESSGLTRVKTAIATRDSRTALIEAKSFLQKYPKSAEGRILLGQQLVKNNEWVAAVAEFQRALESGAPAEQVLPALTQTMLRAGDIGRLVSIYKDQALSDPQAQASVSASVAVGMAMQGDLNGANQLIDRALAQSPKSAPARLVKARLVAIGGDPESGLRQIDAVIAEFPEDVDAWNAKGDFLMRLPDRQVDAKAAFERALALQPDNLLALASVVPLQLKLGHVDAARQAAAHMAKVAPRMFATGRTEAAVAYATGNHARARDVLQQLLKVAPTHVPLLLLAGENELRLNAATQAEAMFAKASALDPANAVARRLLGATQLRLGQVPKALATLEPLVEAPDANAEVLALAAEARSLNGEARAAQALYDRIAKLKPSDPRLKTLVATAGFGRVDDDAVFDELRRISSSDQGVSADLALINALVTRNQGEGALKALDTLAAKQPKDPVPLHLRGQVQTKMGKLSDARRSFEQALVLRPGYLPSLAALSALDAREGKLDQARERFAKLVKAEPKNAVAMLALAELMERQGTPAKDVAAQITAAVKVAPNDVLARVALINHHLRRSDFEAALNAAVVASAAMPGNLELLALLAQCQMRENQTSQALATFGKMSTLQPKSPQPHLGAAEVQIAGGQFDAAKRSIQRALELAPGLLEARAQQIVLALREKQPAKAMEIAQQVQRERPTDAAGYLMEGDLLARRGQWNAAAVVLRKALDKQQPRQAPIRLYQALARSDRPGDAETFAAQWLKAHPGDIDLMFAVGDLAQGKGDLAAAQKAYERVLALQADHALALNNFAMLLIQQKKPGALAMAQRAADARPNEPAVLDTLALAQAAEGQVGEAINIQRQAVGLAPNEATLRIGLAKLLIQNSDRAQAKTELDKLAKFDLRSPQREEVAQLSRTLAPVLPAR